jgi:hypothetical protein
MGMLWMSARRLARSQPEIDSLPPEQEALIPVYREKWRMIALSS